jgi:orotidine-5'-phosphate decarboxylase
MDVKDRIIVALDVPDVEAARAVIDDLGDQAAFYKIGYELAFVGGLALARELAGCGIKVFLDLKLHDIPNTIEKGVGQIARMGMTFLTVHAYPQTLAAAARGAAGSPLKVLGVSVMTSMHDADLQNAGYGLALDDLVQRRARQTFDSGCHGLICSASDLAGVRAELGRALTLITPGIRPLGSEAGDQKRVMTPGEAIRAGADHLVIGRPIVGAQNRKAAMAAIMAEVEAAMRNA